MIWILDTVLYTVYLDMLLLHDVGLLLELLVGLGKALVIPEAFGRDRIKFDFSLLLLLFFGGCRSTCLPCKKSNVCLLFLRLPACHAFLEKRLIHAFFLTVDFPSAFPAKCLMYEYVCLLFSGGLSTRLHCKMSNVRVCTSMPSFFHRCLCLSFLSSLLSFILLLSLLILFLLHEDHPQFFRT